MVFTGVFVGMQFGAFNVPGSNEERNQSFFATTTPPVVIVPEVPCADKALTKCAWNETPEWGVVKGGLTKDAEIIARVSTETGVSRRMIAAVVVPEQIRFFTSNREVFKKYFEPLKILGSMSQFSLGVSGIKEATARAIELNAASTTSAFYPGDGMSALIAYPDGADHDSVLFARLTNAKDHYYSYLYTALFIKEVEAQWKTAGFDVSDKPEVIVTLFNLGFGKSKPNPAPAAGGAIVTTGGTSYTYGRLGTNFYTSDDLIDIFPR